MLPLELIASLQNIKDFDQSKFVEAHNSLGKTSIRINPNKPFENYLFDIESQVPWANQAFYLKTRPSFVFDPLWHAGAYYVQEASSMAIELCFKQHVNLNHNLKILDLCAAPGGKSTHILSLINDQSLLVSNETIGSRVNVLKENINKWGFDNVMITNNDPKDFSQLTHFFDVIIVDAPCSGSGLFRKNMASIEGWSLPLVEHCVHRQKRILTDVFHALKPEGILIYSTCSFSACENEEIVEHLIQKYQFKIMPLHLNQHVNITDTGLGLRFWPYQIQGEGFFMACLKKTDTAEIELPYQQNKKLRLNKKENTLSIPFIKQTRHKLINKQTGWYAIPETQLNTVETIEKKLRVIKSGLFLGESFHDKFIPSHELAMSNLLNLENNIIELDIENALNFLRKNECLTTFPKTGWYCVSFKKIILGWIKVLNNRSNNYYPNSWRIKTNHTKS